MTNGTTTLALPRLRTSSAAAGAQGTGVSAAGMAAAAIAATANRKDATTGGPAWDPLV